MSEKRIIQGVSVAAGLASVMVMANAIYDQFKENTANTPFAHRVVQVAQDVRSCKDAADMLLLSRKELAEDLIKNNGAPIHGVLGRTGDAMMLQVLGEYVNGNEDAVASFKAGQRLTLNHYPEAAKGFAAVVEPIANCSAAMKSPRPKG